MAPSEHVTSKPAGIVPETCMRGATTWYRVCGCATNRAKQGTIYVAERRHRKTSGELWRSRCHWPWPKQIQPSHGHCKNCLPAGTCRALSCEFGSDHKITRIGARDPLIGCARAADGEHHHEKAVLRLAEHIRTAVHIKPGSMESWREKELILCFFDCYRVVPPKTTHVFKSWHTATTRALLQFQFKSLRSACRQCAGLACSL